MNYEIVTLTESLAAGICARTSNLDPNMSAVIGGLWSRFYQAGVYESIVHKADGKALGMYLDYESDAQGAYTAFVGCRVTEGNQPDQVEVRKIPAGKYAKFVVKGNMVTAVAKCWEEIWKLDLQRSFVCDFEEYQNEDMEQAEIHIYIGLKEQ